jgi:hypothetical protein
MNYLGKFSETSLILEQLKVISGGSVQKVDRKGVAALKKQGSQEPKRQYGSVGEFKLPARARSPGNQSCPLVG